MKALQRISRAAKGVIPRRGRLRGREGKQMEHGFGVAGLNRLDGMLKTQERRRAQTSDKC